MRGEGKHYGDMKGRRNRGEREGWRERGCEGWGRQQVEEGKEKQ